jgi:hypothetical protein
MCYQAPDDPDLLWTPHRAKDAKADAEKAAAAVASAQEAVDLTNAAVALTKEARLRRGYFVIIPPIFWFV